jgi:hypothetical protein
LVSELITRNTDVRTNRKHQYSVAAMEGASYVSTDPQT